jgi:hypothetical protein
MRRSCWYRYVRAVWCWPAAAALAIPDLLYISPVDRTLCQPVLQLFPRAARRVYWLTTPAVLESEVRKNVYHSQRLPFEFRNFDNHKV